MTSQWPDLVRCTEESTGSASETARSQVHCRSKKWASLQPWTASAIPWARDPNLCIYGIYGCIYGCSYASPHEPSPTWTNCLVTDGNTMGRWVSHGISGIVRLKSARWQQRQQPFKYIQVVYSSCIEPIPTANQHESTIINQDQPTNWRRFYTSTPQLTSRKVWCVIPGT
jgi:hypothetical protein